MCAVPTGLHSFAGERLTFCQFLSKMRPHSPPTRTLKKYLYRYNYSAVCVRLTQLMDLVWKKSSSCPKISVGLQELHVLGTTLGELITKTAHLQLICGLCVNEFSAGPQKRALAKLCITNQPKLLLTRMLRRTWG